MPRLAQTSQRLAQRTWQCVRAAAVGHEPYGGDAAVLRFLRRLDASALCSLELFRCTDARLAFVATELTGVTRLQLGLNYEAVDLRPLAVLTALTALDIGEASHACSEHFDAIGQLTRLRQLNLQWGAPIRDANMVHIARCTALTDLALRGGIARAPPCVSRLLADALVDGELTYEGARHLTALTNLTSLQLTNQARIGENWCVILAVFALDDGVGTSWPH